MKRIHRFQYVLGLAAAVLTAGPLSLSAGVLYVDNRQGSDRFDGTARLPIDFATGPVKTIARALERARPGDAIVLANTGVPYYESLSLVGSRHSRLGNAPFTIVGNGSVLSGALLLPPDAWKKAGAALWKVTPQRKGHYLLLVEGRPLPEHPRPAAFAELAKLPVGHWTVWRGSIYYRGEQLEEPAERPFAIAAHDVGLTLYDVRGVLITGVRFQHFRLDGVNAHDLCSDVSLENVELVENGRAGLAVGGTSEVVVTRSKLADNRRHSLLVTELGFARLDETEVSDPPAVGR